MPGFLDLRGGDLHTQEELLSLQRLKESVVTPALSQRPVITLASLLPVGYSPVSLESPPFHRLSISPLAVIGAEYVCTILQVGKGVPAPYTGVKAIVKKLLLAECES